MRVIILYVDSWDIRPGEGVLVVLECDPLGHHEVLPNEWTPAGPTGCVLNLVWLG